ncbi:MAG: DUF1963 domain-containing protein [Candidatus Babeliales bacterium]
MLTDDELKKFLSTYLDITFRFHGELPEEYEDQDPLVIEQSVVSKFGGKPYSEGEPWPVCGLCTKELFFIFQVNTSELDLAEVPKTIEKNCLYTFFICKNCFNNTITRYEKLYCLRKYAAPSLAKMKEISSSNINETNPRRITFTKIKQLKNIELLDDDAYENLAELADSSDETEVELFYNELGQSASLYGCKVGCSLGCPDGTKYLGMPFGMDLEKFPSCRTCYTTMDLLFQISAAYEQEDKWTSVGHIYLFYCQEHPENIVFKREF